MSKELIGKIRDELSDGGVMVAPYWAELLKESAQTLESQAREIERLQLTCNDIDDQNDRIYAELAALKAQQEQDAQTIKVLQAMVRQLKAQPASGGEPFKCDHAGCVSLGEHHPFCEYVKQSSGGDDAERAAFEVCGVPVYQFQCREIGEGDWGPCDHNRYMYCQKSPEHDTRVVQVGLQAPSHGEQVLEGWQLVPVEPTPEMISAAEEAHMPFGDMDIALRCALFAAPSPASQKEKGE